LFMLRKLFPLIYPFVTREREGRGKEEKLYTQPVPLSAALRCKKTKRCPLDREVPVFPQEEEKGKKKKKRRRTPRLANLEVFV